MKRLKCLATAFLSCVLSLGLFLQMPVPVSAKGEAYTYTIRFFSGKQGSFAGGEMMVFEGLHYGDRINFYQNAITLNDNSKYYVRGIRESGKDNSVSTQTSSFRVTGDMDYVVAYGILGDATSYTINYVDTEGNTLAPSETYYGNVGDRPVVAYIYIEGWVPEAYNLTQTLKKDPAENVFDFVYSRDTTAPAVIPEGEGGVTVIPAPAGPVPPGGGEDDLGEDQLDEQEIEDQEIPQGDGPDEERDLDEDDTPLSNFFKITSDAKLLGIPVPVVVMMSAATAAIIGIAAYFLLFKKKRKKVEKK